MIKSSPNKTANGSSPTNAFAQLTACPKPLGSFDVPNRLEPY